MQITRQHLAAGSLEQQHGAIVDAVRGKTILVVRFSESTTRQILIKCTCIHQTIDDCWSAEHFNGLDVVDVSTESRVLVSSRISGLLSGTEVRLSLFTVAESVEVCACGQIRAMSCCAVW